MNFKTKKGAMELSIGTIVIIVLAMSMLILGLVLIRSIFSGAKYNIESLNKNVEAEINQLFNEKGGKSFVYLPNNQIDVKKGKSFGIAFGIKNTEEGTSEAGTFNYRIEATDIQQNCRLTEQQANSYLILGSQGSVDLLPGSEPIYRIVRIQPPESAPLCEIWYDITITKDGQPYDTNFFTVKITG